MGLTDSIAAARDQLNRTLTFFPRVDGKSSVVLAVVTSMLAVLATRALPYTRLGLEWIPIGLTLLPLSVSLYHLYREAFPNLTGGEQSLLYFREIASRTEPNYIDAWASLNDEEYVRQLLGQIWRNSEILKQKFNHLRLALIALAFALAPWCISLAWLSTAAATVGKP